MQMSIRRDPHLPEKKPKCLPRGRGFSLEPVLETHLCTTALKGPFITLHVKSKLNNKINVTCFFAYVMYLNANIHPHLLFIEFTHSQSIKSTCETKGE